MTSIIVRVAASLARARRAALRQRPAGSPEAVDVRVGLIDGGVDAEHAVFATRRPQVSGCGGTPAASEHGTAVASLFVGRAPEFHGAAPGAELVAVDVYCGMAAPGGRVRDIVVALGGARRCERTRDQHERRRSRQCRVGRGRPQSASRSRS